MRRARKKIEHLNEWKYARVVDIENINENKIEIAENKNSERI